MAHFHAVSICRKDDAPHVLYCRYIKGANKASNVPLCRARVSPYCRSRRAPQVAQWRRQLDSRRAASAHSLTKAPDLEGERGPACILPLLD